MKKILLLEDDRTIREVTLAYLRESNYAVTPVNHGRAALEVLEQDTFDLAILDIMTPFVTGLQVLEQIQKKYTNTAAIMLTALGDESTQLQAFDLCADDYITKPYSPQLLLKRIEAVLRRHNQGTPDITEQSIIIDKDRYNVYWRTKSLQLTLTEFLIFETLYNTPEKIFTREELLDRVFQDEFNIHDRVIDAHIKNLRKKLPKPWVLTVRGIGYTFTEEQHR